MSLLAIFIFLFFAFIFLFFVFTFFLHYVKHGGRPGHNLLVIPFEHGQVIVVQLHPSGIGVHINRGLQHVSNFGINLSGQHTGQGLELFQVTDLVKSTITSWCGRGYQVDHAPVGVQLGLLGEIFCANMVKVQSNMASANMSKQL